MRIPGKNYSNIWIMTSSDPSSLPLSKTDLSQLMCANCRLLLFTRYPEAGKTKTRLIPALGETEAAQLQRRLSERVILQSKLLTQQTGIETTVYYAGGSKSQMCSWLGPIDCVEQSEGDIGQRMHTAFLQTFEGGSEKVVLIGSDIPDITADLLQQAFSVLLTDELVIGPSQDGGYYLVGLSVKEAPKLLPLLFSKMPWSSGDLFASMINRLEAAGYTVPLLPTLRDIDMPSDLQYARERGLL